MKPEQEVSSLGAMFALCPLNPIAALFSAIYF